MKVGRVVPEGGSSDLPLGGLQIDTERRKRKRNRGKSNIVKIWAGGRAGLDKLLSLFLI